jgi:hypothetical protein
MYYGFEANYNTRKFSGRLDFNKVGENYLNELGINPRLIKYNAETEETFRSGFININPQIGYVFFNKNSESKLNTQELTSRNNIYLDYLGKTLEESNNNIAWNFNYKNTSFLLFYYNFAKVNLTYPTNILEGDVTLSSGDYKFSQYGITFGTDNRKIFKSNIDISYGGFFEGTRFNLNLGENFRVKSWANFGISYNYNYIKLGSEDFKKGIHLLKFISEISFTNNLFWNTTVQKNSQNNNFSIYTRLQWRFLPMSDLFIIFNDNYDSQNFNLKNKGVILKLTYWF